MLQFDWNCYTGNLKWLKDRTIYLSMHGSHCYGTSTPTSDLDIRGIAIAPKEYYLGMTNNFEQATSKDPDLVIFELRKFIKLASECNPNALEIIFTDEQDHFHVSKLGYILLDNRNSFLSKRVKFTFQGYAHAQMKRILLHRRWLLNPIDHKPTRAEFGMPERTVIPSDQIQAANAAIKKRVDEWNWHELESVTPALRQELQDEFIRRLTEITNWSLEEVDGKIWYAAANSLGFSTNFIEFLDKERLYTNRLKDWQHYQEWKVNRNPARAEMEAKFGFDGKHASHLVRLSKCCKELLTDGVLRVRRPDAEELLSIRNGAWSFEYLLEWFKNQEEEIEQLYKTSTLRNTPNINKINDLCVQLVESSW
jgi:predicted nucleotidyltransferase